MINGALLDHIIKTFVVAQAAFIFGVTLIILLKYSKEQGFLKHIICLAISYCMLILVTAMNTWDHQTYHYYHQWPIYLKLAAYLIGDWGLWIMLQRIQTRNKLLIDIEATKAAAKLNKAYEGLQGKPGETGMTGEKGDKGDRGKTGAIGEQGEKGEKGDKGRY